MLDRVEVVTDQGVILTLPLQDISEGFSVRDIDGLDPVKATLVSSAFAQIDGEQYQSARREKRNITMQLGFEPDFEVGTVQMLRRRLYEFFMPKSRVLLRFFQTGEPAVEIIGRVESFDSPKFVKEPVANISIICYDPAFVDPVVNLITGSTTSTSDEIPYLYTGSIETGFLFKLFPNRSLNEFAINNRSADDILRTLEFGSAEGLQAGDVLSISTVVGNKFVTLNRAGVDSSFLYGISSQSSWVNLFPGENRLRISAEGAGIPYTIEYTTKIGAL